MRLGYILNFLQFLVCNKWTCCGEVINNEFGLENEHAETG